MEPRGVGCARDCLWLPPRHTYQRNLWSCPFREKNQTQERKLAGRLREIAFQRKKQMLPEREILLDKQ